MGGIKTTDGIAKEDCLSLPGQDTLCLIIAISTRKSKALMWRLIWGNVLRFLGCVWFPKNIFRKIFIFRKCYFQERKMYSSCLVASKFILQKINSGVWFIQIFLQKMHYIAKPPNFPYFSSAVNMLIMNQFHTHSQKKQNPAKKENQIRSN